jgi:hypothetical protein
VTRLGQNNKECLDGPMTLRRVPMAVPPWTAREQCTINRAYRVA